QGAVVPGAPKQQPHQRERSLNPDHLRILPTLGATWQPFPLLRRGTTSRWTDGVTGIDMTTCEARPRHTRRMRRSNARKNCTMARAGCGILSAEDGSASDMLSSLRDIAWDVSDAAEEWCSSRDGWWLRGAFLL